MLKSSPLDEAAQLKWDDYTEARDEMLKRTHTANAPWFCVKADKKKRTRINILRHLVHALAHKDIIDRFGRFPHRNAILGRTSTAEELELLKGPGSSF